MAVLGVATGIVLMSSFGKRILGETNSSITSSNQKSGAPGKPSK
jgi:hypothetical protein